MVIHYRYVLILFRSHGQVTSHHIQVEDARASMDLFRALEDYWEGIVDGGSWPCTLPPREYSEYFL